MNCVIIDDDQMSRRIIEEYVRKTDFLALKYSFSNAVDAINNISNDDPVDIVFLDIEMPEMSGIDFLNTLSSPCQIVIISSKEKYALEAFEYNVTDYLLKPILYSRFYKAVEKATSRYEKTREIKEGDNEIFIKKNAKLVRVRYDEIIWIEALENYVVITTYNDKYTIHFTMKAIESKLPSNIFLRVHRSYIVNKSKIIIIEDNSVGIEYEDDTKYIPIGKSYRDKLLGDINVIIK
ncbi:LytR/AlgR family response regulator transcription factor [Bacteroidota bacterium]